MILADTSVWINHFRNIITPAVQKIRDARNVRFLVSGDVVLAELLQGARDDLHAARIEATLRRFRIVNLVNDALAVKAARNYRSMRQCGHTMNKIADLFIGTYCIEHDVRLLHDDRAYDAMEQFCGLHVLH